MSTLEELEQKQQELQFKQEELLEQQKELAKQIEELKEKDNKQKKWQPKKDDVYYFVDGCGEVDRCLYYDTYLDRWRISQRNYFRTQEEAEQYLKNLITKTELRKLADDLNCGEVIDWEEKYPKYSLYCNFVQERIFAKSDLTQPNQGAIYCIDRNFAEKAIERIGEKELIEMIKSGV